MPEIEKIEPSPEPTPEPKPTPSPPKEESYELVVDGEKRNVTLDEMKNLAQKASGAEKKFQDASDLRKSAEDGIRLKSLVDRLSDDVHEPTETEIKELAGMIGVDATEFAQYLKEEDKGNQTPAGKDKGSAEIDKDAVVAALQAAGYDLADMKATNEYSRRRHIDSAKNEIRKISDETVDKDEIFGKMNIGESGKDRIDTIKDMVAEDVLRRIQDGTPFGAELVAASVQKIRAYLTKFGTPGTPEQHPLTLGLGPGGGLPLEVQSDKLIPRISAADDASGDNFVQRAMQKALHMRLGRNKK